MRADGVPASESASPGRIAVAPAQDRFLTLGSRHAGVVIGSLAGGDGRPAVLQVQLAGGPLLLAGAPSLPPGTRIALQVTSVQPLQVALQDARPPAPAAGSPISPAIPDIVPSANPAGPVDPGTPGRSTTATGAETPVRPDSPDRTAPATGTIKSVPTTAAPPPEVPLAPTSVLTELARRAVAALTRSRPAPAERADRNATSPANAMERSDDGGWTTASVPLLPGTAVEQVRLLFRQPNANDQKGGDRNQDAPRNDEGRFVVELMLDRLGRLQLDSLVRASRDTGSGTRRLDMVLRSERPLSVPERDALRTRVQEAAARHGLAGGLFFHAGNGAFVEPAGRSGDPTGIVV